MVNNMVNYSAENMADHTAHCMVASMREHMADHRRNHMGHYIETL